MCTESTINYIMLLSLSRLLSFPTNLINASDTRRGIAKAFGMWSDVSPFSFREVPADQEADIKIGGYSANVCISPQQMSLGFELQTSALLLLFLSPCCHRWNVFASKAIKSQHRDYITKLIFSMNHNSRWKKKEMPNNFHTCQSMVKRPKLCFIGPSGCKLQGPA